MSYEELKIGKLVQKVLRPLILSKATLFEVAQMQGLEYSKETFGIQYPLLLKTSSPVAEKHYYSELLTLYGETYRLCCEWFETAANNDRPYVEKWIREHEGSRCDKLLDSFFSDSSLPKSTVNDDWDDFFGEPEKKVEILPMNGVAIGMGQYKDREDLRAVEIPKGVEYIGQGAFKNCRNLKEITIPESVVCIDASAFKWCFNLEIVKLPSSLTTIGVGAFDSCSRLQEINIPGYVRVIPSYCFSGCSSLKKVIISSDVHVIMDNAFEDCVNLSSFSLYGQENLNAIFHRAFAGCKNLVFETIDQNVFIGDCNNYSWGKTSVMVDKNAFDWEHLTIRTFAGTAGAKLAQGLGIKVEYVKDER